MRVSLDNKLSILAVACMILCGLSLSIPASAQILPNDKGKVEFVHNCTACHRADLVVAVKKTPEDWRKSVDDMAARGTDGTKEDLDNVVIYLDKYFSTETAVPAQAQPPAAHPAMPDNANNPQQMSLVDTARLRRILAESDRTLVQAANANHYPLLASRRHPDPGLALTHGDAQAGTQKGAWSIATPSTVPQ